MEYKMEQWKGTKCQFGYINKQKKFQFAMLMLYVLIGVGLFLIGLAVHKTRANLFTVLGILMVLPAAKRVIALVLMTDYVFTSTEKVMSLDFVIVMNKNVYGIKDGKKTDDAYVEKYLSETISAAARGYRVQLFENEEAFLKMLKRSERKEETAEERSLQEKVVHDLTIIAV